MKRALYLAEKGSGYVNPNPKVGAVIVKNGKIIGEGFHERFGENHAEINALNSAGENARGAEIYVTLEPCSHFGKTPPCARTLVKAGLKKVIIAMKDPNPIVSGRGIKILRENGIEVVLDVMKDEAEKLNEVFIKYITTKRPFVLMKSAVSLDGKIATTLGESKWISGEVSRQYVHKLRNNFMAIMVGIGTVISDDPLLTTRIENKKSKSPIAIILDSKLKVPLNSRIFTTLSERKIIIATTEYSDKAKMAELKKMGILVIEIPSKCGHVNLKYLMNEIGKMGIDSILLEGGSKLNFSCIKENIVDKVMYFVAPKLVGGEKAKTSIEGEGIKSLSDAVKVNNMNSEKIGQDILLTGYVEKG
ncbi:MULTISPECIES: bifunctional diaminohydroxyphosphoribosylaminopyrimidine deaminase/5-amino-6-(5-phosphoribosylamino)uracil reductase RibD [Clostridium]|uniref:bifunctional diaminohydroxyphosphoribosylaminopyrimidine deaminase/5-amino-6-(5-phosphoribosylamino)uracil reductase RibD n=1 Tax=Clostridium TaxID=1485 RepID=UPI0008260D99|nr:MULTISPECIES: bifunctional diaminohydroxyphosphoribosylaminopyrimidine deaminase/5-amino-6-(5-phosphoribosylamino)uracil reductase RibD [Clostridium]PJI10329.1 riboflavin biosynthesis protein RibD [Clostridium sp. CT7]